MSSGQQLDFTEGLNLVRTFKDYPRPGVTYYDLTPLLGDAMFFGRAMERFIRIFSQTRIDYVVSPESRGYMFGAAMASRLGAGFVPIARYGTLPGKTISVKCPGGYHHDVENTKDLSIHEDSIHRGSKVLVVDDILGSGHTAKACQTLVETLGASSVEMAFFLEISNLQGRDRLAPVACHSLMKV